MLLKIGEYGRTTCKFRMVWWCVCFTASTTNNFLYLLKWNRITLHTSSQSVLFSLAFERSYFTPVWHWFTIFSVAVPMHLINIFSKHLPCHSWFRGKEQEKVFEQTWSKKECYIKCSRSLCYPINLQKDYLPWFHGTVNTDIIWWKKNSMKCLIPNLQQ